MKHSAVAAIPPLRKALAEQIKRIADLQSCIEALSAGATKDPVGERKSHTTGAQRAEIDRTAEQARLQQELAAAIAARNDLLANIVVEEELPRRIKAYQDLVQDVNKAWNEILAYDGMMRRRFPGRASVFNTAGPHERAVVAPSTDRSPLPALEIDSRALFATASRETERFVEALAQDAEAQFGKI